MVQGSGFVWKTPPSAVFPLGAVAYIEAVRKGIKAIVQKYAPEVQNWMRANAGWTDRTGNARQALHTEVEALTDQIALYLAHGMTYGVHLELRNSGRYAIIGPALDEFAPKIWADVSRMMGR